MDRGINPGEVGAVMSIRQYDKLEQRISNTEWNLTNINEQLKLDLISLEFRRIKELEQRIEALERRLNG